MPAVGPAQFPRDVTDRGEGGPGDEQQREKAKLRELEEARRAGAISEEEFEQRARRLKMDDPGE